MGRGFKGDTGHHHTISENLPSLTSHFSFHNGYFGEKGEGTHFVRVIKSDDPVSTAKDFYNKIAYGGLEYKMSNGKGVFTKMRDGSILSFREVSSSDGSPAVDINISKSNDHGGIKQQKIHFVKGS